MAASDPESERLNPYISYTPAGLLDSEHLASTLVQYQDVLKTIYQNLSQPLSVPIEEEILGLALLQPMSENANTSTLLETFIARQELQNTPKYPYLSALKLEERVILPKNSYS